MTEESPLCDTAACAFCEDPDIPGTSAECNKVRRGTSGVTRTGYRFPGSSRAEAPAPHTPALALDGTGGLGARGIVAFSAGFQFAALVAEARRVDQADLDRKSVV